MATTDYSAGATLQDAIPHTHNSLQKLVMAMAKFQKNKGKKTLFGKDKGREAWEAFEQELKKTMTSMFMDGIVERSASPDDYREALVRCIEAFAAVYPNWKDAYGFAEEFLVSNENKANDVIKALRGYDQMVAEGKIAPTHQEQSDKKGYIDDFEKVISAYEVMSSAEQIAVAASLAISWKAFNARFGSAEEFCKIGIKEQVDYIKKMSNYADGLAERGQKHEALGATLMKMYLAPLMAGDHDLAQELAMKLEPINQKGFLYSP